jgi:hypothetical protein
MIGRSFGFSLCAVTHEPEVDIVLKFNKDGDTATFEYPTGKRSKYISGFLYGAAVTVPTKNGVDASTQAAVM